MPCKVVRSSGNLISVRITGELKKTELDQMQAVATEFMNLTKGVVFMKRHVAWCCMIVCCIGCLQFIGCGAGGAEIKQTATHSSLGQELQDSDAAYRIRKR